MSHDRLCPISWTERTDCPFCQMLGAARAEEIEARNRIWKDNLPRIERRNYEQGYRDGVEHARRGQP